MSLYTIPRGTYVSPFIYITEVTYLQFSTAASNINKIQRFYYTDKLHADNDPAIAPNFSGVLYNTKNLIYLKNDYSIDLEDTLYLYSGHSQNLEFTGILVLFPYNKNIIDRTFNCVYRGFYIIKSELDTNFLKLNGNSIPSENFIRLKEGKRVFDVPPFHYMGDPDLKFYKFSL